jgi:CRISPR system Cascade subunit CasD
MGMPILLLRLEGPLQSWGGRSRWDVRDTQPEPSKSGVIGLLSCALGYGRGDRRIEALDRALRFGVRVEAPGRVLEDYQTITGYLPTAEGSYKHTGSKTASSLSKLQESGDATPATIISPRFYLEDAAFLVALAPRTPGDTELLKQAAAAVKTPRWPLFLGRKACLPTRPIFGAFTEQYADIESAFRECPWSWHGAGSQERKGKLSNLSAFIEDEQGTQHRQDAVRLNPTRTYGFIRLRSLRVPRPQENP